MRNSRVNKCTGKQLPFSISIFFLLLVFISCTEKTEILSKEEAMVVSRMIDSSITHKMPRHFNELLDEAVFAKKVSQIQNAKKSSVTMMGIKKGLERTDLGDKIIHSLGDNGHYELVKHYEKNGTQHLLYRLYSEEGLNYHDFELCKRKGKAGIADIYIYLTGEELSVTISQLLSYFDESISKNSKAGMKVPETINRIREFMNREEYEKAYNYYKKLPEDMKEKRTIQIMFLLICQKYDSDKYREALQEFQARFPDDPNSDLLLLDAYIMDNDIEKAMASINNLDRFIDADPFLDFYRALISNIGNKPGDARNYLERLCRNYPNFDDGFLELIANYISAEMNDKANTMIKAYRKNEKFDQELLENYLYTQPQFHEEENN